MPERLSKRELKLILYLASRLGKLCSRPETMLAVEGTTYDPDADAQRVDAMIERVRRKIGDTERPWRFLFTHHARGHHLEGYIGEFD